MLSRYRIYRLVIPHSVILRIGLLLQLLVRCADDALLLEMARTPALQRWVLHVLRERTPTRPILAALLASRCRKVRMGALALVSRLPE